MVRLFLLTLLFAVYSSQLPLARAEEPPTSWVDKDTGHRVIRLTPEAGSSGLYFNVNAYSADGKLMIYVAPDGIHTLELATLKTRLLVPTPPAAPGASGNMRSLWGGKPTASSSLSPLLRHMPRFFTKQICTPAW